MMIPRRSMRTRLILLALLLPAAAFANEPAPVRRDHVASIAGTLLPYTAVFDRFAIDAPGRPASATITTISYIRSRPDPRRPVIFAFNGGPGSSSIFLNIGMLGPRRVDLPADPAAPVPARAPLVNNRDSVLDTADIVLVDPVGTGFSRLRDSAARGYFYSVHGDAQAVADAIAHWTRSHGRAASAKFVLGESYGSTRAVLVAADMLGRAETANLAGLIVVSQSLQIVDTVQRRSNIVGQVAGMPTLAASAWYHSLAGEGRDLDAFVAEASAFARARWLPALMAGSTLLDDQRRDVAAGLSRYTGVPVDYLLAHDLYLTKEEYRRIALAKRGLLLGLYDTRYVGPIGGRAPDGVLADAIAAAGGTMWREQFGIDIARFTPAGPETLRTLGDGWTYVTPPFAPTAGDSYRQIDYVADLLKLMADCPRLRLLVAGGWFDTAASAGADDYLLSRPGLDRTRTTAARYRAGHMFYTDPASRVAFAARLRAFIAGDRD